MRNLKLYLYAALVLTAVIWVTGCSRGKELYNFQTPSIYRVLGTVQDSGGSPLPDTAVVLNNNPTTRVVITITDEDGNYSFVGLDKGDYRVTPQKSGMGFTPKARSVTLTSQSKSDIVNFKAIR